MTIIISTFFCFVLLDLESDQDCKLRSLILKKSNLLSLPRDKHVSFHMLYYCSLCQIYILYIVIDCQ